ncbi:hypothetical protein O181_009416 [Austropuccinia psidii MF-1]|uniref:Uncharacterized protein n=1 Tax=Austropuccinia psidii MF-1 TaxID=1389203 RepID=A0A9Q3BRS8_9BASI|nr:hypothetical protein [Austropuccinia psidii MF-1]
MKFKLTAMLHGDFMCILFLPFPICVIAPDFQPTINFVTDEGHSTFDLGTAYRDHEYPILPLFNDRGDFSTFNKDKQISSNNACEAHIAADLYQDQFGPYNGSSRKRLFDLALGLDQQPVQEMSKQPKATHSAHDQLQTTDPALSDQKPQVLDILDHRSQNPQETQNEYYLPSLSNIPMPLSPCSYSTLLLEKDAFSEPHYHIGFEQFETFDYEDIFHNLRPIDGIAQDSVKKKITEQEPANINSTPGDFPHNLEERANDALVVESNSSSENHSFNNQLEEQKIGNLNKDRFLAFLSPLGNCYLKGAVPEKDLRAGLQIWVQKIPENRTSSRAVLKKLEGLVNCAMSLNLRFLRVFIRSVETRKSAQLGFRSFLLNTKEHEHVKLRVFVTQSDEIKTLISEYFRVVKNEQVLPSRVRSSATVTVSKLIRQRLELALLSFEYYYKNMNENKWEYLFGQGTRFWGFWAALKLKFEGNNIARHSAKLASFWDKLALFPWVTQWDKVPEPDPQSTIAPTLAEWQKYHGERLSVLQGIEKHFLPPKDSWTYERIRLGLESSEDPSTDRKKTLEGDIKALEKHFLAIPSSSNPGVQNERIGRSHTESFVRKIELLMLRVYKLNFSFLNRVGKGNPSSLIQEEQQKTQDWLKESLTKFLLNKLSMNSSPTHIIAGPSSNTQNSSLLLDMLEKIIQEQSKFDKDSGSFETEVDDMITQLALVILAVYYEEVNSDKWEVLFSRRTGSLDFVEFMVVCLNNLTLTKNTKPKRLFGPKPLRQLFPWEDLKTFETIPPAIRNFKFYTKKEFQFLEEKFSTSSAGDSY